MSESGSVAGLEPSVYHAPNVLLSMGKMLTLPRQASFSTKFADIFSDDSEVQHNYARGLVAVGFFFVVFLVLWCFVLIVLKLKGKEVGCASGRPFQMMKNDEPCTDSSSGDEGYSEDDLSSNIDHREDPHQLHRREMPLSDYDSAGSAEYSNYEGDNHSQGSWITEREARMHHHHYKDQTFAQLENPREKKTRGVFLLFSVISLVLVPFILVFSFGPMKEATDGSKQVILLANDAMDTIFSAFNSIELAGKSSKDLLSTIPDDLKTICPLVDQSDMDAELGVDLSVLLHVMFDDLNNTHEFVEHRIDFFNNVVGKMQTGNDAFEEHVQNVEYWMWIVPGVLFSVSVLAAISMLGALVAWKKKSGTRFQMIMSYIVLPLLILTSIACWSIVVMASVGTILTSDICTRGPEPGSPENTINEILAYRRRVENDTIKELVHEYTSACQGSDPTEYIGALEKAVQENVDNIWRQISIVDSIGRAKLIDKCGGEYLLDFLTGSRNIAKLLTAIRRSLRTASESLECDQLYPIYTQTVHDSLCTDAASAASYGFIMFLVLAISTMIMISLRASWLQSIEEEKVYDDEDDIAENMVVNEHEEYLAYISRYKHEWQEYKGFHTGSATLPSSTIPTLSSGGDSAPRAYYHYNNDDNDDDDDKTEGDNYTSDDAYHASDECSDEVPGYGTPLGLKADTLSAMLRAPSDDECNDDISFPSLKNKSDDSNDIPSSLFPPAKNPQYNEFELDQIFIPKDEDQVVGNNGIDPEGRVNIGIDPDGRMEDVPPKPNDVGLVGALNRFACYFNNGVGSAVNLQVMSEDNDKDEKDQEEASQGDEKTTGSEKFAAILPSSPESQGFNDTWV